MTYSEVVGPTRERLGPVGVWLGALGWTKAHEELSATRRIEELGYGSIFCPERIGNKEAFAHVGALLAATEGIIAGSGIASVWARHPATMQAGGTTLGAFYPGRFILGIGISHASSVERSGQSYERPMDHMARYLDAMDVTAAARLAKGSRWRESWRHCVLTCSSSPETELMALIHTSFPQITPPSPGSPSVRTNCSSPNRPWFLAATATRLAGWRENTCTDTSSCPIT